MRYTVAPVSAPSIPPDAIPEAVIDLCERLARSGYRAWVVGGCIRDLLMGERVSDWDLATDATPEDVMRVFRRTVPTGIAHGTVTVLHRGGHYEVTTLRGEGAYSDGRRPDSVHFVSDIEEDLARRDFTVNAIAFDPRTGEIVDPWCGVHDLQHRVVRAVRDPRERFGEDGLRVLRAARFVSTLEFTLDPATEAAIPPTLETFRKVSPERVHDEWVKALTKARAPSRAFDVMRRTGMLAISGPAIAALDDDAFARALRRVDETPRAVALRVAALLWDAPGDHDVWMRAFRFSNEVRELAAHLLRVRGMVDAEAWSDADVRRFVQRATRAHVDALLELERADRIARGEPTQVVDGLAARVRAQLDANVPLVAGDLAIGGKDVMSALGSGPGRHVGRILAALLARVVDDPSINTRERLLALVPEVAKEIA
ncbi:Polynucleotide adenylyltransferase [Sandaracinus amylolyticus]|nr:Polynucleotide adenylyltransferase [Sandaracinus amylolyticus]